MNAVCDICGQEYNGDAYASETICPDCIKEFFEDIEIPTNEESFYDEADY